jgi:hypothetical protein
MKHNEMSNWKDAAALGLRLSTGPVRRKSLFLGAEPLERRLEEALRNANGYQAMSSDRCSLLLQGNRFKWGCTYHTSLCVVGHSFVLGRPHKSEVCQSRTSYAGPARDGGGVSQTGSVTRLVYAS